MPLLNHHQAAKSRPLLTSRNLAIFFTTLTTTTFLLFLYTNGDLHFISTLFRSRYNVLRDLPADVVHSQPYPFLIREDVIPHTKYLTLAREFPSVDSLIKMNYFKMKIFDNMRVSASASTTLGQSDDVISPAWKEFIRQHTSPEFLSHLIRLFGPALKRYYPGRFDRFVNGIASPRVGIRTLTDFEEDQLDFQIDMQICVNTPVEAKPTSVRLNHLDSADKIFTGLLYLRDPTDDTPGGDLQVYEWATKEQVQINLDNLTKGEDPRVVTFADVKYGTNNMVFFLNTPDSLHGVTLRHPTKFVRRFVNFIVMVPPEMPLFKSELIEYDPKSGDIVETRIIGNYRPDNEIKYDDSKKKKKKKKGN